MNTNYFKCIRLIALLLVVSGALACPAQQGELKLTDNQRDQLLTPVLDDLRKLNKQGEPAVAQYLKSLNLGSLDNAEPNETAEALDGISLSKPFFGPGRNFNSDKLLAGSNIVVSQDEYKKSFIVYSLLEYLLAAQNPEFVRWLANRSTRIPSTRGDLIVIASLPDKLNGFSSQFWKSSAQQWKVMLTAKNPAYRLLALRNAQFFETDAIALLNDYKNGLQEKNTVLQNASFEELKRVQSSDVRVVLRKFLNDAHVGNDRTMPKHFDINAEIREFLGQTKTD